MARNLISQAVDGQERTGVERLRDTGRLGYRATAIRADTGGEGIAQAFGNFVESAGRLYGMKKQQDASRADERSNEIIRKLTPEQRRAAVANGTLLYQDDPDAMEALRYKTGRNAAFEVESEIKDKIAQGQFKDRQQLIEYRKARLEEKARSYAESVGVDFNDQFYQRGFNADIVSREAALYDLHGMKLSEQTKAVAQMEAVSDLGSMMSDERFLRSPTAPEDFVAYFNHGLSTGSIPTDEMAAKTLAKTLADNVGQPGAEQFMLTVGEQTVNLHGSQIKVKDLLGPEVMENYKTRAQEARFTRDKQLAQDFTFGIQNALAQPDPHKALAALNGMYERLNKMQQGDGVTAQSEQLNAARGRVLGRIAEDTDRRSKEMTKMAQADVRLGAFERAYEARIAGENTSTDYRTFETNEATGEFKEEDAANFAARKLRDIDRMDIPEEVRDAYKLKLLNADHANGPFRKHFQTLTTDAVNQFNGLVVAQGAEVNEETTARLREFQRVYAADPATIASLYPEQAALAERLDLANRAGMGLEVVIDAERQQKGLSKEERIMQDRKWAELLTGSTSGVRYLPTPLRNAARTLYQSELARTGDESSATSVVNDWLNKSAVQFTSERPNGDSSTVGAVQKRTLMVDPNNAQSWRQGQELLNEFIREIAKAKPWINEGDITITETPQGIQLRDPMGSLGSYVFSTKDLQEHWKATQAERAAAASADRAKRSAEKIGKYKAEQERRSTAPFKDLGTSTGTLEGAMGFEDKPN